MQLRAAEPREAIGNHLIVNESNPIFAAREQFGKPDVWTLAPIQVRLRPANLPHRQAAP
jgi:hypothetical protein